MASFAASESATISASHDESAMASCLPDRHEMAACCHEKTHPVVECLTAQSESVRPWSGTCESS